MSTAGNSSALISAARWPLARVVLLAVGLLSPLGRAQSVSSTTNEENPMSRLAATLSPSEPASDGEAIRPFRVDVPEDVLVDMRRRILATRWPDRETVTDHSQGVPLALMRELAGYWATDY